MKYLLTLLWLLGAITAQAQEYTGHVADKEDGAPVAGAIVTARDSLGKPLGYTTTSASGDFVLRSRGDGTTAQLDFSTMGYRRQSVPANAGRMLVLLTPETTDIREVTIRAPRLSFRGDTVSYNVSRFTEAQDRSIADVLRKMPGIEVAKSGEIRYNGQPINNFYIEGLDMLDGRYGQATNNIAPQDVASVEVMENHQPIKALKDMIAMAASYGFDISRPAENAKEAVQWLYFGYLAGIKEQNGAAMSLGRTSTFLDIYFERDIEAGLMTESEAQEIMDDFVLHLRMARHLRTPEYNELFGGDPMWITEAVGGIGEDGRHMVTKNSYRMLNTLYNLNAAAEPNLTVLWSENLPENWKKFIAKVSIDTDALQYENDDVMRPYYGDDYAIACCVSAMRVGKDMQFFGARANIAKLMMMAINGGRDENKFEQVGPEMPVMEGDVLDYEEVLRRMDIYRPWLAKTYVSAMNTIHYMHDKYAYEKSQMALHDTEVRRLMAFGIAGMSCMADSLSAIKYAKVRPIRNPENGIIVDFEIEGDFPKFGNDDDRVDQIACEQVEKFYQALTQFPLYRGAIHTMSILTITSNVMYGKKTGNTPDGRRHGEPLAPGANPMSGRDVSGALASLNSVAKLSYTYCRDGISNTFSITPGALGKTEEEQVNNLVAIMGGYFAQNAHHLNVNVLNRETLMAAYEHPEQYPNLTIRVSGYAVNFYKLSREQQREVISRTFHEAM